MKEIKKKANKIIKKIINYFNLNKTFVKKKPNYEEIIIEIKISQYSLGGEGFIKWCADVDEDMIFHKAIHNLYYKEVGCGYKITKEPRNESE